MKCAPTLTATKSRVWKRNVEVCVEVVWDRPEGRCSSGPGAAGGAVRGAERSHRRGASLPAPALPAPPRGCTVRTEPPNFTAPGRHEGVKKGGRKVKGANQSAPPGSRDRGEIIPAD